MLDKMMAQMQEQTDEINKKLDAQILTAEAESGLVTVKITGNKKIVDIAISDEIAGDTDAVCDLMTVAVNRAIAKAEALNKQEMDGMAQNMMPGFGDMFK